MDIKEFTQHIITLRPFIQYETRRLLYDKEYVEDIISKVISRLWKSVTSERGVYGGYKGLQKLSIHFILQACFDVTRKWKRSNHHSLDWANDELDKLDIKEFSYEPFIKIDLQLDVNKALSYLPGKMNSIAKLIMEGYTHKERANLLDITLYHEKQLFMDMKNNLKRILTIYERGYNGTK